MDALGKLANDASKAVTDTAKWAQETVAGKSSEAKAEADKNIVKSDTATIGQKVDAGVGYLQNKGDQAGHEAKAEGHKQSAKNT